MESTRARAPGCIVLFSVIPSIAGCGATDRSDQVQGFLQTDSAGVTIAVTSSSVARSPLDWQVDSVPDVIVGAAGAPDYFHRVQGVESLPDGGLLVVDGSSAEILYFDADGMLVNRVGGRGEGPGEFIDPVLVPWVGSDSLLVYDQGRPHFQILSRQGESKSAMPRVTLGRQIGALERRVVTRTAGPLGGELALREPGMRHLEIFYFWADLSTGERDSVASFVVPWFYRDQGVVADAPYAPRPTAVVGRNGVLISDGETAVVREFDSRAELRRIIKVDEPRKPVTNDLRARVERPVPVPDSLPTFTSLQVDELGWLWAQLYHPDLEESMEWMVFNPEGRAIGVLDLPTGLQVTGIGEDHVLGIWRDELGVEQVHQHGLRRTVR